LAAATLDANSKKPALVLVHHNPGLTGNLGLKDTAAFLEIIRPRRQVKAYIYGHTHTWRVEKDSSGIHLINLRQWLMCSAKGSHPAGSGRRCKRTACGWSYGVWMSNIRRMGKLWV